MLLAVATAVVLTACRDDVRAASAPPAPLTGPRPHDAVAAQMPVALHEDQAVRDAGVSRHDFVLEGDGIDAALRRAGIDSTTLVDAIDEAFVGRIDLFAHARVGRRLSLWKRGQRLVAAKLEVGPGRSIFAALYDGPRAPRGFYDADGRLMTGTLLARPVHLRRITSRFGDRFDAFSGKAGTHHGIDYGVPRGTGVAAVGRGRVAAIGKSSSSGNFIKLAHADGYASFYFHLDHVDEALRIGSIVEQGQHIADSGNTGRSTGAHLHYELHLAGIPVDPLAVLPMPKVVLGPLARREHLAFLKNLEATHDRRADHQQDHPPRAVP